jgi:dCTP deaminase
MILTDMQIRTLALNENMLHPFSEGTQGDGIISYGLTSAGYDLRLGYAIDIFKNSYNQKVNPKAGRGMTAEQKRWHHARQFDRIDGLDFGNEIVLPPHSYALAYSLEYIRMPRHLKGRCVGKSTYARCGLIVNTTPLEPGWHGHLTIEIANTSPCPVSMFAGEGIAQLEFETLGGICEMDYERKGGKYQGQGAEPVAAKVKE